MHPSDSSHLPEYVTGRLRRSLEQPLRLLHHSDYDFFILGATGKVYTVTLFATPTCNCPDATTPCKHILFLYTRVLSVSVDEPWLQRHTLRPCELSRLISAKVSEKAYARASVIQRFHELYGRRNAGKSSVNVDDYATCPVCYEEVEACATCKSPICDECLVTTRVAGKKDEYINLSAYVSEGRNMAHVNVIHENCDQCTSSDDSSSDSEVEGDVKEPQTVAAPTEAVQQDQPAEEELPPQPYQAELPEHPRYIYKSVRLPARVEALLEEVAQTCRLLGHRMERIEDLMQWHVQVEIERARAAGFELPPLPPPRPREYPDAS